MEKYHRYSSRRHIRHGVKKMDAGELRVWKDAYGAPSLDPVSLQALTYIKINRFTGRIKIVYGRVPQWAPIPGYRNAKGQYKTAGDIIQAIRVALEGNDTDTKYYSEESSKIEAYKSYVNDVFGVAYQFIFWYDTVNLAKITKPYYCDLIPFPFSYFYVRNLITISYNELNWIATNELKQEYLSIKMSKAEQCLLDLSDVLGQKPYLLGDHPSSLDALVYSFLAPIYYAPIEKSDFQVKLKTYYNLTKYILRITKTYFPDIKYEPVIQVKEDENERAPWWQVTLAGLSAFTVMCWFAYSKGLVRVVF